MISIHRGGAALLVLLLGGGTACDGGHEQGARATSKCEQAYGVWPEGRCEVTFDRTPGAGLSVFGTRVELVRVVADHTVVLRVAGTPLTVETIEKRPYERQAANLDFYLKRVTARHVVVAANKVDV